ncbi:MAG: hypothetical protein Q4B90_08895 [Eubacteriales bacterium]|nr:hypothetical protein [Eubacteriales bacterium]
MRRHHRFRESLRQLSYDKPGIDNRAIKIRKSLDDVKKTLDGAWKKKDRGQE